MDDQADDAEQYRENLKPVPKHRIRLPGFLMQGETGLGDVIKKMTSAIGITPCDACRRRAEVLNRWLSFRGRS
jgi:hypothetical protein